ncbi:PilZ domain-containing protein [Lachnospiraceae bacterium OM04-12BH]|nr:PilZ domain-containing protein [Lachnospiraceae bacterium OM04-12BH]
MEERRKCTRMKLISQIVIKRIDEEKPDELAEINILDVSRTGIGFACSKALEIGAIYEAYLRIWTQEVLHAFIEIVRIEKKEQGFSYGGIFIGMPAVDGARIEVYNTVETLGKNN